MKLISFSFLIFIQYLVTNSVNGCIPTSDKEDPKITIIHPKHKDPPKKEPQIVKLKLSAESKEEKRKGDLYYISVSHESQSKDSSRSGSKKSKGSKSKSSESGRDHRRHRSSENGRKKYKGHKRKWHDSSSSSNKWKKSKESHGNKSKRSSESSEPGRMSKRNTKEQQLVTIAETKYKIFEAQYGGGANASGIAEPASNADICVPVCPDPTLNGITSLNAPYQCYEEGATISVRCYAPEGEYANLRINNYEDALPNGSAVTLRCIGGSSLTGWYGPTTTTDNNGVDKNNAGLGEHQRIRTISCV